MSLNPTSSLHFNYLMHQNEQTFEQVDIQASHSGHQMTMDLLQS